MTEKQLQIFIVVAKKLNISKAAEELYTTQPYLSRQIKCLEEELGVILFLRKNRFLELTPAGKELFKGTKELFEKQERLVKQVKKIGSLKEEKLKIGYMHIMLTGALPEVINTYKQNNINLNISLESTTSKNIIDGITNKSFDLGIVLTMGTDIPDNIHLEVLNSSKIYIALQKNHHLAKNISITIDSLLDEKLIFLPKEMAPYIFQDSFNPFSVKTKFFKNYTNAENMFNAISLVRVGMGITPIAKDYSFHSQEDLVFIPIEGLDNMDFSLIWRKDNTTNNIPFLVQHIKNKNKIILVY